MGPRPRSSPLVEQRFCEYMTKHRVQADGTVRDSDNWQKGMTLSSYIKGLKRHVQHLWLRHRRWPVLDRKAGVDIKEDVRDYLQCTRVLARATQGRAGRPGGRPRHGGIIGTWPSRAKGPGTR